MKEVRVPCLCMYSWLYQSQVWNPASAFSLTHPMPAPFSTWEEDMWLFGLFCVAGMNGPFYFWLKQLQDPPCPHPCWEQLNLSCSRCFLFHWQRMKRERVWYGQIHCMNLDLDPPLLTFICVPSLSELRITRGICIVYHCPPGSRTHPHMPLWSPWQVMPT